MLIKHVIIYTKQGDEYEHMEWNAVSGIPHAFVCILTLAATLYTFPAVWKPLMLWKEAICWPLKYAALICTSVSKLPYLCRVTTVFNLRFRDCCVTDFSTCSCHCYRLSFREVCNDTCYQYRVSVYAACLASEPLRKLSDESENLVPSEN